MLVTDTFKHTIDYITRRNIAILELYTRLTVKSFGLANEMQMYEATLLCCIEYTTIPRPLYNKDNNDKLNYIPVQCIIKVDDSHTGHLLRRIKHSMDA